MAKYPQVRLGEILTERKETPNQSDIDVGNVRIVSKIGFAEGRIELRVGSETKTNMILIRRGDLVLSGINAAKGAIAIYDSNASAPVAATIHYSAYSLDDQQADLRYLWWFLRSSNFREILLENVPGGIKTELKASRFLPIPIPLPPLAEQQRIVARIEELARRVEEARGLRQKAQEETESLKAAALDAIFQSLESRHHTKEVQEVCDVVRGGSPRPAGDPLYYGGDIPFIKVGDITKDEGKFLYEADSTVNELGKQHSRFISARTLMLTNSGATLGVPKITMIAGCFNDGSQAFLNLSPMIFDEYLYYFFSSKTRWFRESPARGQGQPNLNTDMVKPLKFPCPPLDVQKEIVAYFDGLQAKVDDLRRLQAETQKELDALMPSVLAKAFAGEL